MNPTTPPRPGATRFTEAGDVEFFDGREWLPAASLLADPALGQREGPEPAGAESAAAPGPHSGGPSAEADAAELG